MELKHLDTFRTLAEELSFTRTALRLNYAQSSVTAHIQALEKELGVPLFDRMGAKLGLTNPGERLLKYAKEILKLVDDLHTEVPQGLEPSGRLTVGSVESLCAYKLSPIIREFKLRYPKVSLTFYIGVSNDLRDQTRAGLLDLALLMDKPTEDETLVIQPLSAEKLMILVHPSHSLAIKTQIHPCDLEGETILYPEPGSYRSLFEKYLVENGVRLTSTIEFSSVEAIKQSVIAGIGIALLPEMAVTRETENKELIAIEWSDSTSIIESQICWNRNKWMSPAATEFITLLQERFI